MKRETRTGEIRAATDDGTFEVLAVAYDVVDDYGTRFVKGCFTESLAERLPVIAWAHSWADPIGRATDYRDADEGLYLTCRLDIGGSVARADQAHEQMRSGTLTDVSVGFMRTAERTADDDVIEITEGELDEVSVVLRGAVPGAKVLAVRSARAAGLDFDDAVEIAKRKAAGDLTDTEAEALVELLSSDDGEGPDETSGGGDGAGADPPPEDQPPELSPEDQAVLDAAEDIIDGRSR